MLLSRRFVFCTVVALSGSGGAGIAEWLECESRPLEIRRFEKIRSEPSAHVGHRETEESVKVSLEPVALLSEEGKGFLRIEARHDIAESGLWVLNSLGVYDDQGREYVPQTQGKKQRAKQAGLLAEQFEIPMGLPDGIYAARMLTAHSTQELDKVPMVRETNLYFEIDGGDLSLIDALQFAVAANSHPAVFGKDVR